MATLLLPTALAAAVLAVAAPPAPAPAASPTLPAGTWDAGPVGAILARTETLRLAPDLSRLGPGERAAVAKILEAGALFQRLYELQKHDQAPEALRALVAADEAAGHGDRTRDLLALYRLSQGPVATTLENERVAFVGGVHEELPGRNVYPLDATREEIDAFLATHPEARDAILAERTVVRRATAGSLAADLATLRAEPGLALLHPHLGPHLEALATHPDRGVFYAVPDVVAWPHELVGASRLLGEAADAVAGEDPELARYLRNRSRDLLTNDYESGDAAWVTGRFRHLNVQIGSYETYDDALFGVKAFHSLSLLVADEQATARLRAALGGLQATEDALPYEPRSAHRRVREDIPVGVYQVVADFGQARGTNTASILPNDPLFARRYGRTILLRENVQRAPAIAAASERVWRAVTAPAHAGDLDPEGDIQRTLWHEIGHYLGVDRDRDGRPLDVALGDLADATEEMKADLASLFSLDRQHAAGTLDDAAFRAVQAAGIRRTLQNVRPRADQPYQTMQLVQFNWFLEHGLLAFGEDGRLRIDYARYAEVTTALLAEVLKLQQAGDHDATAAFYRRWTTWDARHEALAKKVRDAQGARWRIVTYGALGE